MRQGLRRRLQRGLRDPRRIVRAGARWAAPVWGHHEFVPFVILSRSRTGSNLLASFFNSHPEAHVEGEILGRLDGRATDRVLARVWGVQARYIKAKGFKLFYYHPLDGDPDALWQRVRDVPNLRVLHLKRRNILRTLVSRKIAESRGEWTRSSGSTVEGGTTVRFSSDELEAGFRQTRAWEQEADERVSGIPSIVLEYEDLVADPFGEFSRATALLGLRTVSPTTSFRRQNPERLSDLVTNFEQLRREFRGTIWQSFFDEDGGQS